MKISDLFRQDALQKSNTQADSQRVQEIQKRDPRALQQQPQSRPGEDTVSISSVSRQLNQISQILAEDESSQSGRVAELKRQVEAGEYNVSSDDVARSVVSFARDLEPAS